MSNHHPTLPPLSKSILWTAPPHTAELEGRSAKKQTYVGVSRDERAHVESALYACVR